MIRLFAALALPPDIAEGLIRRQHGLPGARWRPAEALHITLRFFGELSEPVAADLDEALGAIRMTRFEVGLQGAGAFGEARSHAGGLGRRRAVRAPGRPCRQMRDPPRARSG